MKTMDESLPAFGTLRREYSPKGEVASEVLAALRDGDEEAYRTVYLQFAEPLVAFLHMLTRSQEQAEDLAQEILANLWIRRERIDPAKSIKGFLFTIARQTAIDYRRQTKARDIFSRLDWLPDTLSPGETDGYIIARETELIIKLALETMPPQRRRIFEMSKNEGLSNEEIARKLGIAKTSVDKQISYARRELREFIKLLILLFLAQ